MDAWYYLLLLYESRPKIHNTEVPDISEKRVVINQVIKLGLNSQKDHVPRYNLAYKFPV